jgi:EAL domain-containing protein (putative c-di-GMP-specific phosphodiesterase class I)
MLKLDMALIRGADRSAARQAIVARVVQIAAALDVQCIAEGAFALTEPAGAIA